MDLHRDGDLIAGGVPSDPGTYPDSTGERDLRDDAVGDGLAWSG